MNAKTARISSLSAIVLGLLLIANFVPSAPVARAEQDAAADKSQKKQAPNAKPSSTDKKSALPGTTPIESYSWSDEQTAGRLKEYKLESQPKQEPSEALVVKRDQADMMPIELLTIANPSVKAPGYVVHGKIRYDGVEGDAYLEMWNHFPDGSAYFTRTLGAVGPMAKIAGKSDWREIALPFVIQPDPNQKAAVDPPSKLVINLVLPGKGSVSIGRLQLAQLDQAAISGVQGGAGSSSWWSPQFSSWIGALLGTSLGISGAAIGVANGFGRGTRFAVPLAVAWIVIGSLLALLGLVAWIAGQSFHVYFPVLMTGLLATIIMGGLLPVMRQVGRERELRRMHALDVA